MKLDQLRYFVQVVECHSFNQAAKNLYMTQPALTASIQALEQELQVTLLRRSNKGTYPTAYGLQVYEDCKDILQSLEGKMDSWKAFAQENEQIAGTVHLAAIPVLCNFLLEDIIWGVQQQYPEVSISLHEISMVNFSHEMLQGHYNVGLTSVLLEEKQREEQYYQAMSFQFAPLLPDEYRVYLSTKHPYAQKMQLTAKELAELELIYYSDGWSEALEKRSFPAQTIRYLNSLGNILQSIAENKGAGTFLYRALEKNWYVKNGFICAKPLAEGHMNPSEHYLIWAEDKVLTGAEKAVVAFIRANYAKFYETQQQED